MRKRIVFAISLFLPFLAFGCVSTTTPNAEAMTKSIRLTPGIIVPGVGLKNLALGASEAEVEASLGKGTSDENGAFTHLNYYPKGLELILQKGKVETIRLHSRSKKWGDFFGGTSDGLGIGKTSDEIVNVLGPPDHEDARGLNYSSLGLKFRFDRDQKKGGRVQTVILFLPDPK